MVDNLLWLQLLLKNRRFDRALSPDQVDDFSESERQLEQQFDNRNAERLADIERLQEENDQLVRELNQLNIDAVCSLSPSNHSPPSK